MTVKTWEARLAAVDHSRGTTNKMIQGAMTAEIVALRAAVATGQKRSAELRRVKHTLAYTRLSRDEWRDAALRYQRTINELVKKVA